jgi:hypothetical protein
MGEVFEERVQAGIPETFRDAAEQVAQHLAMLCGCGCFLSSLDGRLLVAWLEEGVSPGLVVTALERAAERRRRRRVKSPLRLESCQGEIRRLVQGIAGTAVFSPSSEAREVGPGAAPPGDAASSLALDALEAIDRLPAEDPTARLDAAMSVVRCFHEEAWKRAEPEHAALRARAEAELLELKPGMEENRFAAAVEEVARDLLRQRYPLLSATSVWDRLHACEANPGYDTGVAGP